MREHRDGTSEKPRQPQLPSKAVTGVIIQGISGPPPAAWLTQPDLTWPPTVNFEAALRGRRHRRCRRPIPGRNPHGRHHQRHTEALSRPRYGRRKPGEDEAAPSVVGVRHGHRERTLTGTFGKTRIAVPRARLTGEDGKTREWRSGSLRAYQRRTRAADALIAGAYLAGTNTRRVRRALNAVLAGPVGKDVVSRVWRKTKGDWDAWNARSLAEEPIVRLILDGTVARVRLDRRATSISLLVALGVRADGQKMLLAIKSMGGEGEAAWRALLDDLVRRGLRTPELVVIDGAPGLEKAVAALWPDMAVQRCTQLG